MTSVFGWMDQDDAQRAAMNEIVKMFQDQGSVDELGIGAVRDAFSNHFFPGTSVLHTRVRYLLFVPWLLREAGRRGHSLDHAKRELRQAEVRLIRSLLAGKETAGVIGSRAQESLRTMPSQVYWPALQRYGVVRWSLGVDGHLRRMAGRAAQRSDVTEGDAADALGPDLGLDDELPAAPEDLLSATTFDLTVDEATYLQGVFARLPGESLLSRLATRPHDAVGGRIWTSPAIEHLPDTLQWQVDHARRLHHAWHGAPLLYNLMLAELVSDDALVEEYGALLEEWEGELDEHRVFEGWDRSGFWALVRGLNPRLRTSTQSFVEDWIALAESSRSTSPQARSLVKQREIFLKARRSRLLDVQARESWTPGAGTARLGYRWGIAVSFLADIDAGLTSADDTEGAA